MTTLTQTSPRRWLRFGVRTILVLMVLVAIPLAWKVNRVWSQRRIVKTIENAGGNVEFDYEVEFRRQNRPTCYPVAPFTVALKKPIPPGPSWLHDLLGNDFFSDVVKVTLPDGVASHDDILSGLSELPGLTEVIDVNVSDEGLVLLGTVPSITKLTIGGPFTEAGLAHLATLPMLEGLELSPHSKLANKDMVKTFVALKRLTYLFIETMSDEDIRHLRELLPGEVQVCTLSGH